MKSLNRVLFYGTWEKIISFRGCDWSLWSTWYEDENCKYINNAQTDFADFFNRHRNYSVWLSSILL